VVRADQRRPGATWIARIDAGFGQPAGDPVAVPVELAIRQVAVPDPASRAAPLGDHDGRPVRLASRHGVKIRRNI
jgi:hypothetical protein